MEWTAARIRQLREVGLSLSQDGFAAKQADDTLAVLHLLEAERVAEQAVSRNVSAIELLSILVKRERRGATPGLRGLAARAGLLQ